MICPAKSSFLSVRSRRAGRRSRRAFPLMKPATCGLAPAGWPIVGRWFVTLILACAWAGLGADAADPLKILVIGGHPDDPESCAGGFIARAAAAGHDVSCVYFTSGEAGIEGKSASEASVIRRAEAEKACRILGARPVFLGQSRVAMPANGLRISDVVRQHLLEGRDLDFPELLSEELLDPVVPQGLRE